MSAAEFLYTVLLKPKPLRKTANAIIRGILPGEVQYGTTKVVLNPNDPVISGALTFRVYERSETAFLQRTFFPGMVFLDIGANVGYYTAMAAAAAGPHGRVIALEPDPENFKYLKKTVSVNGAQNVSCLQLAAADRLGHCKLHVSATNRGDNRLYSNELASSSIDVGVTTIDHLLEEMRMVRADVIKMDVQGVEGWVLKGMRNTLRRIERIALLSEFWPDGLRRANTDPKQVLASLEESGLQLYELQKRGTLLRITEYDALINRYPGRKYTNIVAVRS